MRPQGDNEWETAHLPWGLDISIQPADVIGSSIVRTAVFELSVSEAIWRLLDPGELAVDVGANIGYMTSLMASRVGPAGRVLALEPHPELFMHLRDNARRWVHAPRTGEIVLHNLAASDRSGTGPLYTSTEFNLNMGTATLRPPGAVGEGLENPGLEVTLTPLDTLLDRDASVGLLKVDVEGHELSVLMGARNLLKQGRVRDIIVEELQPLPTPVSELLESYGYRLFGLEQRLAGIALSPAADAARPLWDAPTYLATKQADRALARAKRWGWKVLRSRRPRRGAGRHP